MLRRSALQQQMPPVGRGRVDPVSSPYSTRSYLVADRVAPAAACAAEIAQMLEQRLNAASEAWVHQIAALEAVPRRCRQAEQGEASVNSAVSASAGGTMI